jgi:outer membrane cobalamin receptor
MGIVFRDIQVKAGRWMLPALLILFVIILLSAPAPARGADTMLMFVGEDQEVLSIASRRTEAAWSAPAVADVVTKEEMDSKGAFTIADALEDTPGFYMNRTEKGSIPYLRGIENSALFLYDTVPMGSGIRKSGAMIDHQTSLAPVKRIEVVRGTGSVLWGPDAFAGVVNVVPMTGKDLDGVQTGLIFTAPDTPGEAFVNFGRHQGDWATFFSVSGRQGSENDDAFNVINFWHDHVTPEPPDTRFGTGQVDDSRAVNVYGSAMFQDWLTLSVRVSDSTNAYTAFNWDHTHAWEEQVDARSTVVKLEAARRFTPDSGLRFTGYYSHTGIDQSIVDLDMDHSESTAYGEFIYDQALFHARGLLTAGASLRRDDSDPVPVWESFFPDFFDERNRYVLPLRHTIDVENDLSSVFAQYRHDFDWFEIWAGTRYDNHSAYEDKTSASAGLAWNPGPFRIKTIYGTAYRTPFASQLKTGEPDRLEEIRNLNVRISWENPDTRAAVTFFRNKIDNHVTEDRYAGAGLSSPNSQTIDGVELALEHKLVDRLTLSGSLTLLDNTGPDETYFYLSHGFPEDVFLERAYAYDTGPDILGSVKGTWRITDSVTLVPELRYFSGRTLYYPKDDITRTCAGAWTADLNLMIRDRFPFDLSIHLNNLFDTDYSSPGLYSVIENQGFSGAVMLRMNW